MKIACLYAISKLKIGRLIVSMSDELEVGTTIILYPGMSKLKISGWRELTAVMFDELSREKVFPIGCCGSERELVAADQ